MAKASSAKSSSKLSKGLDSLLSGNVNPEDFAKQLFFLNFETVRSTDPKLAQMMRACAIPRRFDAKTVGVLRGKPKDYRTNKRLLEKLKAFQFVLLRKDGDYVYHDNTRDVVLAHWKSPENRREFKKFKQRLVRFYQAEAIKEAEKEDYAKAVANLNLATELEPTDGDLHLTLGVIHHLSGDYPTSLSDFTEAVKLQSDNQVALHWRGLTNLRLNDFASAKRDLTEAIKKGLKSSGLYYLRGETHFRLREYDAAVADLTKAIKLDPDEGNNYLARAIVYFDLKKPKAALADLTRAISLQPASDINYYWRGGVHYQVENYELAIADLTKAIELSPENGKNYMGRSTAYLELLDYDAALADIGRAIKFDPQEGGNYYLRGLIHYRRQDYAAALSDFEKAVSLKPDDVQGYMGRGTCLLTVAEPSVALRDFSRSIELAPDKAQPFFWRGTANLMLNDQANAKSDLSRALALAKRNVDACARRRIYARVSLLKGELNAARKHYTQTLTSNCDVKSLHMELSHLIQIEGLFPTREDISSMREWLQKQPRLQTPRV